MNLCATLLALRWPVVIALVFGGCSLAPGIDPPSMSDGADTGVGTDLGDGGPDFGNGAGGTGAGIGGAPDGAGGSGKGGEGGNGGSAGAGSDPAKLESTR